MSKTLAEIACLSTEIKEIILKRFKHDRKFNPNMDALCTSIESAKDCDDPNKTSIKVSKGKKKTERSNFMGNCMRSTEKGGMAKSMKECSDMFKSMPASEKGKYNNEKKE
jgi:hypothetical protein